MQKEPSSYEMGYQLADGIVKEWNANSNPPKVYIGGKRIHHGLVGLSSAGAGLGSLAASGLAKDEKTKIAVETISGLLIGIGVRLMEDDIEDMPDWFNFET